MTVAQLKSLIQAWNITMPDPIEWSVKDVMIKLLEEGNHITK
jgi:hypothetical protein